MKALITFTALLAVATGCQSDKAAESTATAEQASEGGTAQPPPPAPPTGEPGTAPEVIAPATGEAVRPQGLGGEANVGGAPSLPGRILLPPAKAGESLAQFDGCLAVATPSDADGKRFPEAQKGATRGPAPTNVRVTPTGGGIVVEHQVAHACCLKGEVTSDVEGGVVTVTEKLSGDPCRCRCTSTIKTAVGLAPGSYTVRVEVDENGRKRTAHEQPLTLK